MLGAFAIAMGCGEGGADEMLVAEGHIEDCARARDIEPSMAC